VARPDALRARASIRSLRPLAGLPATPLSWLGFESMAADLFVSMSRWGPSGPCFAGAQTALLER